MMTAPHPWMLRLEQERRDQHLPIVQWMFCTQSTRRTVERWTHPRQAASPRLTDVDALLRLHRMIILTDWWPDCFLSTTELIGYAMCDAAYLLQDHNVRKWKKGHSPRLSSVADLLDKVDARLYSTSLMCYDTLDTPTPLTRPRPERGHLT